MGNVDFCDKCGGYIAPGEEEISIGGGMFEITCKNCHKSNLRVSRERTEANEAQLVSQDGSKTK